MLENFAAINEDKLKHERIGLDKAEQYVSCSFSILVLINLY